MADIDVTISESGAINAASTVQEVSVTGGTLPAETDPIFSASPAAGIINTNITNWNSAYSWGNHASAGYSKLTFDSAYRCYVG